MYVVLLSSTVVKVIIGQRVKMLFTDSTSKAGKARYPNTSLNSNETIVHLKAVTVPNSF